MSSIATPLMPPPLREGDRLTREEFLRRWEAMPDVRWAELIDGVVHMPSPISEKHSVPYMRLGGWAQLYQGATHGTEIGADGTWLMVDENVPQPDIALRILDTHGGQSRVVGGYPAGAPELVIEVSNTTASKDAGSKLRLYERSGVCEYLIAQPRKQRIVWRELVQGKSGEIAADGDGIFRSRIFPGLWLDPVPLWKSDFSGMRAVLDRGLASPEHTGFVRQLAERARAR